MTALTHTDLHHVLSRVPRDILALVKQHRLFIAGGFIRSVIAGEPSADIDLFGSSKELQKLVALELANKRGGRLHETDVAVHEKGDGRMDDEAWVAQVLTGLLREVDPLVVVDGVDLVDEHQATEGAAP